MGGTPHTFRTVARSIVPLSSWTISTRSQPLASMIPTRVRSSLVAPKDGARAHQVFRKQALWVSPHKKLNERLILPHPSREKVLGRSRGSFAVVDADGDELREVEMRVADQIAYTFRTDAHVGDTISCPVDSTDLPRHTLP